MSFQTEALKNRKGERENLGVELYGLQQELARHQMMLEKNHDQYTDTNQTRSQIEQQLGDIRGMYKENQTQFSKDKKRCEYKVVISLLGYLTGSCEEKTWCLLSLLTN